MVEFVRLCGLYGLLLQYLASSDWEPDSVCKTLYSPCHHLFPDWAKMWFLSTSINCCVSQSSFNISIWLAVSERNTTILNQTKTLTVKIISLTVTGRIYFINSTIQVFKYYLNKSHVQWTSWLLIQNPDVWHTTAFTYCEVRINPIHSSPTEFLHMVRKRTDFCFRQTTLCL